MAEAAVMTTATREWWRDPFFAEVLPYINVGPNPKYGHARFELHTMPTALVQRVLSWRMPCVACGREIAPIRSRGGLNKRGGATGVYLSYSCALATGRVSCSRGMKSKEASAAVLAMVRGKPPLQGGLL